MMVLVIGGSGSGKSSYAEEVAVSLSKKNASPNGKFSDIKKYYLATMQVYDDEGKRRIARHRALRNGKGFLTIEQPVNIHHALGKMEAGERTALLECISNLTANEMFTQENPKPEPQVVEHIINSITLLKEKTTHLVIVSNNVFEDGIIYDKATMEYIHAMGMINKQLAASADKVVEVVAGIPITIK